MPSSVPQSDLPTVVHSMVTSRLNYCNMLYMELPLKTVRNLQLAQNKTACVVLEIRFNSVNCCFGGCTGSSFGLGPNSRCI